MKYKVTSDASDLVHYIVDAEKKSCTCPSHRYRRKKCKHIVSVLDKIEEGKESTLVEHVVDEVAEAKGADVEQRHKDVEELSMVRLSQNFYMRAFLFK